MTVAQSPSAPSEIVSAAYFDRTTDGVFVVDRDWTYVFVNAAGADAVGLVPVDLIGREMWVVVPDALGSRFELECRRAMDSRQPVVLEQYAAARDQWHAIRIFPSDDGLTIYYEDISEQRRSERAARRLAAIVDASDDAVVSQSLDGLVLTWNAAAERLFGYRADEIVGNPIIVLTESAHLEEERALIARVNGGERVVGQIRRRVRKDGSVGEVSVNAFPVRDESGIVVGSASIERDMAGQRLAERSYADAQFQNVEALAREAQLARSAESQLRGVLDGMAEGVVETTLDGRIVTVNRAFAEMVGFDSPAALIAAVDDVSTLYADPALRNKLIDGASTKEDRNHADIELRSVDGRRIWVRARFRLREDDGGAIGLHVIVEDVTATRAADAQVREAEERLHFAFHDSPMPLVVIEFRPTGGVISEANAALESLLGYGPGELTGVDVDSFVHESDSARNSSVIGPFTDKTVRARFETRSRHRDGHWIPVALTAVTIRSATGRWFATASIEDITARRAGEEETLAALQLVESRARTEEALADLARLTLESADVEAFGRTACGVVARMLEVDFCSILLPTDDGALGVVAEWGWDRRLLATVDTAPGPDSQSEYTVRNGVSVVVDDWLTDTRFVRSPLLVAHDVRSGMSVAIRYDQATIGAIVVQSRTPKQFDDPSIRFLESVAGLVGVALGQDRVSRRLKQSEGTLQSIVDNAPVAIHVVDHEGRFLLVNRELERIIGMPRDLLIGRTRADVPRLADGAPMAGLVAGLDGAQTDAPTAVEQTTSEADGEHAYLSVNFPLVDADGCTYGVGGISTEVTELVRARAETTSAWLESMDRLARAVEFRDDSTGAHIERMAAYSDLIAHMLNLSDEHCARIRAAARMHDIGKMAIPDHVLLKPGPFTPEERTIMDAHADVGYRLLTGSGSEVLELAATIAHTHHERFDGTGYPNGLVGAEIALEGRIVAIADSFDALTSDRVYRAAMTVDEAVAVMQSEIGHFDPEILDVFVRRLDLAEAMWASYRLAAYDDPLQWFTAGDHAPLT